MQDLERERLALEQEAADWDKNNYEEDMPDDEEGGNEEASENHLSDQSMSQSNDE